MILLDADILVLDIRYPRDARFAVMTFRMLKRFVCTVYTEQFVFL